MTARGMACVVVLAAVCGGCRHPSVPGPAASASPSAIGSAGDGTIDAQLEAIRGRHRVPALAAMSFRGSGLLEVGAAGVRALGYSETVTHDDRWHLGSLTKSMTATVAARLVEQGRTDWATTVSDVFPDLVPGFRAEYASVRREELVTHTAGLPVDMTQAPSWSSLRTSSDSLRAQRRRLVSEYLAMPPGSARGSYRYANAGFIVAGAMLEEVADESWESLMQRLLFEPLGMPSAGFGAPGSPGTRDQPWGHRSVSGGWEALSPTANADNPLAVGPAGTVHASLPDLAAYYRMHLEGDVGRGVLLTPASFERLHRPAPGTSYACGWVVTERDWARGRALWHNGSNTYWFAVVWLAPNRDLGVFAATNVGGDTGTQAADDAVGLLISRFGAAFP